ncbi:WG repeat-containing protein [uncultured Olleya sp.]|uniref:WG repeat-containing protein n=1 Tax=uncultured Olleya sp. TaxID=757243 RepID=UPI00259A5170|nr:WG repeat-containing protein [uncultured Olleya sp.]
MKHLYYILILLITFNKVCAQEKTPDFRKGKNGKYALYGIKGEQLTEPIYNNGSCYNGICRANKNEYVGFIDYNGTEIIPFKYSIAYVLSEGLIAVFNGNKWGFIDRKGILKIPFKFSSASNFSEGLCEISIKKNNQYKYGFINKKGEFVIKPKYNSVNSFSEGFASVKLNNKWAFIDNKGKPITPFKYSQVGEFEKGITSVSKDCFIDVSGDCALGRSTKGFINSKGEEIVPVIFDQARVWDKINAIEVQQGRSSGLYDFNGNVVVPLGKYYSLNRLDDENGLIEVTVDGEQGYSEGYINRKGKEIIPPLYDFKSYFTDGFIYGGKYSTKEEIEKLGKIKTTFSYHRAGVLDSLGNIIIPFKYEEVSVLKNDYFKVKDYNSKGQTIYAYFNSKGKQVLPFKYTYATDFSLKGYALVKEFHKGELFFINTKGKIISTPKFNKIDPFIMDDLVAVEQNNKWGFINAKSKIIIDFRFDEANRFHKGLARVSMNKKFGFINTKGEIIIPIKFDKAHYYFNEKVEEFELDGKKYYFDNTGKEITTIANNPYN